MVTPAAMSAADARHRRRLILGTLALIGATACSSRASQQPWTPGAIIDAATGQLYGAARQGRWVAPAGIDPQALQGREFIHYDREGVRGATTRLRSQPTAETCSNPTYRPVAASPGPAPGTYLAADWDAAPRAATRLGLDNATYRAVVSDWLATRDLTDPAPQLAQALRVDLDGDGRDEVILAAERQRGSITSTRAGDYSVLLLRLWEQDRVVTRPLLADLYPHDCTAECAPRRYRVFSTLDLNGDGHLEVIVTIQDYEALSQAIYSLDDLGQVRLSWNCGP
jgi:hypothetical protein